MKDAGNQHHQSPADFDAERRTHLQQIAVLTEIARVTTHAIDLREMFVVVGDSLRKLIDFDGLTFGIVTSSGRVEGSHATGDENEPLDMDDPALVGWVRSVQRAVVYSDDNVPNERIRALLQQGNFKHLLQAPLIIDGESIGFLAALRHGGREFEASELAFMESVGNFVAVAVRNSLLLQEAEHARRDAETRFEQLASLDRVAQRLAAEASLDQALAVIGDELARLLPFVSCQIWELSPGRDQLVAIQTWGASANTRPRPMLAAGEGIIGDVVAVGRPDFVPDATADPRSRYPAEFEELRRKLFDVGESVLAAPLIAAGEVLGGLLMSRLGRGQFSTDDFRLFVSFAGQIALALRGVRMAEENRELFLSTIRSLASLVDQRETGGHPHSDRVAFLSEAIAVEMQLPPHEIEQVRIAATIHDAGKIGIPESLLVKTDPLTDEERALLMTHPALGASMVQAHGTHPDIAPLIRHHHEWYDGSGYPDGLAGDAIPLGAAIICVAEAFERITSNLPYQAARSTATAKQLLAAGSGQQFHPHVVEAALRIITSFEQSAAPYLSRVPEAVADAQPTRLTLVEMQQREDQPPGTFRILYEIAHEIGAIPELTRFLRQIAQIIGAEMSVANCTIFLLERDSGDLIAAGSYPDAGETARISPADDPLVAAVRAGRPQTLPDDDADDDADVGRYMVPLINDGAPIGAIVVDAGSGHR
ncbi:MAG: HD domain-containing phosphohydrolase [Thermomicrobiales bacterium]